MSALPPSSLKVDDRVRFVSPASSPERDAVLRRALLLEDSGFVVDFGAHAFDHIAFHLAGPDDERPADLNEAFRDPAVLAVFATRGGKGSYRIADRLDLEAVRRDPERLVGFSDVLVLHPMLRAKRGLVGVHGAIAEETAGTEGDALLRSVLTSDADVTIDARGEEETASLTSSGVATGT